MFAAIFGEGWVSREEQGVTNYSSLSHSGRAH